ncbi:MAG: histidine kinase [Anaerolineae bacterium]|jgi:signal transduction histidine kinase|nr:histidine kinase [Anaerolineae bacterium]
MSLTKPIDSLFSDENNTVQANLLEMLFDRMPMGVYILDKELRIMLYNPTWEEYVSQYTASDAKPLKRGVYYFDLFPGSEPSTYEKYQRVLQGETIRGQGQRFETHGVISYWDIALAPIYIQDEVVGILVVTTDANERTLLRQNLEQRVAERTAETERRRKVAESMRDIIRMINTNLPLEDFLDQAVILAAEQMGASGCVLHEFNLEEQTIFYHACYGMENITDKHTLRHQDEFKASGTDRYFEATLQRQPTFGNYSMYEDRGKSLILNDPTIPEQAKERRIRLRDRFAGVLSVPLFIQDRAFGGMVFYYSEPQEFSQEQIDLGMTFADQVAIAIENTRLMKEAEKAAINEERSRLARDLHDAVTQTLFSSSLIADVLPRIWERDPEEGKKRLEELRQLTRGALSEMRTLLVELRPAAMEDTDLSDLIAHLVNAFIAKTRVTVDFIRSRQKPNPPLAVKEMFYRIAQEIFNNIAKHAHAEHVVVELTFGDEGTVLLIRDDGIGFDSTNPEHIGFGLKIMRERAQTVGAYFNLQSNPGTGTIVTVTWQNSE